MTSELGYRYPGAQAFADSALDRELFRGRDNERTALQHLVLSEPLVVVHGKSGTGKSSLINAGLLEALRQQRYAPITVRLNDPEHGPGARFAESLDTIAKAHGWEVFSPDAAPTLPEFFADLEIWSGDLLLTPLLVIDQFEELFTLHARDARQEFIRQFARLIRGTEAQETPRPLVRAVLVIREDFLASLEELADELPTILHTRFPLGALRREDARAAIELPATIQQEALVTRPFRYAAEAVNGMLDFLAAGRDSRRGDDQIEPFQLQLLCQRAENVARDRQEQGSDLVTITLDDFGGAAGLRKILSEFYEREVARAGGDFLTRRRLRRLCEEGLVNSEGRRLSVEEKDVWRRFGVDAETIRRLVKSRVLRPEPRLGSTWYELSHDTLVEPVLRVRDARRLRRRAITVGAIFAIVATGFAFGIWRTWRKAESAELLQQIASLRELTATNQAKGLATAIAAQGRSADLLGAPPHQLVFSLGELATSTGWRTLRRLDDMSADDLVSADEGYFHVADRTGRVRAVDPLGRVRASRKFPGGKPVAFAATGALSHVAGIWNRTLQIWSEGTSQPVAEALVEPSTHWAVAISPDGACVAALDGATGVLNLLDVKSRQMRAIQQPAAVRTSPDAAAKVVFSRDNRYLAAVAPPDRPIVYQRSGCQLTPVGSLKWSSNNAHAVLSTDRTLMAAAWGSAVFLHDVKDKRTGFVRIADIVSASTVKHDSSSQIQTTALAVTRRKLVIGFSNGTLVAGDLRHSERSIEMSNIVTIATGKGTEIRAVAIDATDTLVASASGSKAGNLRVTTLPDLKTQPLSGHKDFVNTLAFHPSRPILLTGSDDGTVRLWRLGGLLPGRGVGSTQTSSLDSMLVTSRPPLSTSYVEAIQFDQTGAVFAVGDDERELSLWTLSLPIRNGNESPEPRKLRTWSLDPKSDGRFIMQVDVQRSGDRGYRVVALIVETGLSRLLGDDASSRLLAGSASSRKLAEWTLHGSRLVRTKVAPPEGSIFGAYDLTGHLTVLDSTNTLLQMGGASVTTLAALERPVRALAFDEKSDGVVTLSDDAVLRTYKVPAGVDAPVSSAASSSSGGPLPVLSPSTESSPIAMAPETPLLGLYDTDVYATAKGGVALWSLTGAPTAEAVPTMARALLSSRTLRQIAVLGADGTIAVKDLQERGAGQLRLPPGPSRWLSMPSVSQRNTGVRAQAPTRSVFFAFNQDALSSFDARTGALLETFSSSKSGAGECMPTAAAAAFTVDRVLVGCANGAILILNELLDMLDYVRPADEGEADDVGIAALVVAPLDRFVASVSNRGMVSLTPLGTGEKPVSFQAHQGEATAVAISPDGQTIATAGNRNGAIEISLWTRAGKAVRTLTTMGHDSDSRVSALVFDRPDSVTAVSSGRMIESWDVATGARRLQIPQDAPVTGVHVADTWLASTSEDGVVRFWDPAENPLGRVSNGFPTQEPAAHYLASACRRLRGVVSIDPADETLVRSAVDVCVREVWSLDGGGALHLAVLAGNEAWAREVLTALTVAATDRLGRTPLHLAVAAHDLALVTTLLGGNADVNAADKRGDTPLIYAIRDGDRPLVELLLNRRAQVGVRNTLGDTALHIAARNGDPAMIRRLADSGADVNAANLLGVTPLIEAAAQGSVEVVSLLIERGAKVDARDENGATALFEAARTRHAAAAKRLLEAGADVDVERNSAMERQRTTALLVARERSLDDDERAAREIETAIRAKKPRLIEAIPQLPIVYPLDGLIPDRLQSVRAALVEWHAPNTATERRKELFQRFSEMAGSDAFIQFLVGLAYERGHGVAANPEQAVSWYERAAPTEPLGRIALAMCLWTARAPIRQDMDRVLRLLEGVQPHPLAALYLAQYIDQVKHDNDGALGILKAAESSGEPWLLNSLGLIYQELGTREDLTKAYSLFETAASKGDPFATSNLITVARQLARKPASGTPLKSLRKAIEVDSKGVNALAYYPNVVADATGAGVASSVEEGRRWLKTCADGGEQRCQTLAGLDVLRASALDGPPPLAAVRHFRRNLFRPGSSSSIRVMNALGLLPRDMEDQFTVTAADRSTGLPTSFLVTVAKEILSGNESLVSSFVTWADTPQGVDFWRLEAERVGRGQGLSVRAKRIIAAWVARAERR